MRPLILRLFSAAKLLLMFELNKYLFLFLNDLSGFTAGKSGVVRCGLSLKSKKRADTCVIL